MTASHPSIDRDASRGMWFLLLSAMAAVGAALRLWHLDAQSLWLDEAQFLHAAVMPRFRDMVCFLVEQDFHPPAYPLILRGWLKLAGTGDVAVRALPVLFGVALIPATAELGRALFGRRDIGLWAALVVTLNGYHLYLSQEARHYTWLALIGVLHMLAFVRLLRSVGARWLLAFFVSGVVGLFSHYHMMLILAAEALVALVWTGRRMLLLAMAACAIPFFALWTGQFVAQSHRRALWGEALIDPGMNLATGAVAVAKNLGWSFLDFSTGSYLRLMGNAGFDLPDLFKAAALGSAGWVALVGLWSQVRRESPGRPAMGVLACLGLVPVVGAIASGFLQANVFETKYVSFVAPLWAVLLGAGCRVGLGGKIGRVAVALFVGGLLTSVIYYHTEAIPWKEDWRHASGLVDRGWRPGDMLLQRAPYTDFSLDHYLPFPPTRLSSGLATIPSEAMAESVYLEARQRGARRLWVVLSHDEHAEATLTLLGQVMPVEGYWAPHGIQVARFRIPPG